MRRNIDILWPGRNGELVERATGVAAQYISPQRRAAALFDGGHRLELTDAQMAMLAFALQPGWPVGAEDVRDLQGVASDRAQLRGDRVLRWIDDLAQ